MCIKGNDISLRRGLKSFYGPKDPVIINGGGAEHIGVGPSIILLPSRGAR